MIAEEHDNEVRHEFRQAVRRDSRCNAKVHESARRVRLFLADMCIVIACRVREFFDSNAEFDASDERAPHHFRLR